MTAAVPAGRWELPHRRPSRRRAGADVAGADVAVAEVRVRLAAGGAAGDLRAVPERVRRALAVATAIGAPAVPALDAAAAALADVERARRAVHVATAQARTVAAGLVAAPAVLVPLLGRVVGADLAAFYATSTGMAVGLAGLAMTAAGAVASASLVRRVGRAPGRHGAVAPALAAGAVGWVAVAPLVGVVAAVVVAVSRRGRSQRPVAPEVEEAADLTAVALTGGGSAGEALRLAAAHVPALALPLRRVALAFDFGGGAATAVSPHGAARRDGPLDLPAGLDRVHAVLGAAARWGAPAAPALRRLAADLRAEELTRVLAAAERLPAQLTFPTTLLLLPATLLLVGAPLVSEGLRLAGA